MPATRKPAAASLLPLGLDHLVLRVASLPRAIGFYRAVLGARVERQLKVPRIVQLRVGAQLVDLVPGRARRAPQAGRNLDHYAIRVARLGGPERALLARRLARFGLAPGEIAERYGAEGYGPSVYFHDPDGNMVELKGPAVRGPVGRRP